jgi:hypothetical protein
MKGQVSANAPHATNSDNSRTHAENRAVQRRAVRAKLAGRAHELVVAELAIGLHSLLECYFKFLGLPVGGLSPWTTPETTSRHVNVWAACRLQIA